MRTSRILLAVRPAATGVQCFGTAVSVLTLTDSTISHRLASFAEGLRVRGTDCIASVGRTTFTRNGTGISATTSTLTSFGNNQFDRNGGDIFGTYPTNAAQ